MKTAVDFLIDWLMDNPITSEGYVEAIIKAKEMEKEQIKQAWLIDGYYEQNCEIGNAEFEEYYNERFKNK